MSAFTKGPWAVHETYDKLGVAAGNRSICLVSEINSELLNSETTQDYVDNLYADATLIAAAPELLEALEEIEQQLAEHPDKDTGNSKVHYVWHKARAAIAKAKGEA